MSRSKFMKENKCLKKFVILDVNIPHTGHRPTLLLTNLLKNTLNNISMP